MKEHTLGQTSLRVVDLLLKHDPTASDEQIANVVSEWGHLLAMGPLYDEGTGNYDNPFWLD